MSKINNKFDTIGIVHSPLTQKFGAPRQPNLVDLESNIVLLSPYNDANAVRGLEEFSHIWVIWQFHHIPINKPENFRALIRPPRLGGNKKVGVFASRSMFRPNNIGLSVVKLKEIICSEGSVTLVVVGADFIDGTPVLDIKPYIEYTDVIANTVAGYAQQKPINHQVQWTQNAIITLEESIKNKDLNIEDKNNISELISLDPRPAYHAKNKIKNDGVERNSIKDSSIINKRYQMCYKNIEVAFMVVDDIFLILEIVF